MENLKNCDKNFDQNTPELSTLAEMNKKELASFKSKNASKALTIILL